MASKVYSVGPAQVVSDQVPDLLQIIGCSCLDELSDSKFHESCKNRILANLAVACSGLSCFPKGVTLHKEPGHHMSLHQIVYVKLIVVHIDTVPMLSYRIAEANIGVIWHKNCFITFSITLG